MSDHKTLFQASLPLAERIARLYSNIPGVTIEDVTAEAHAALYRAACAYDPARGFFEPFAGTVIRNALNSLYQSEARHARHFVPETSLAAAADLEAESLLQDHPDTSQDPVHEVRTREARQVLDRHLAGLPDRTQQVIDLYSQGHSYAEIGDLLGVSKQAAHKTATHAFDHLRGQLNSDGYHGMGEGGMLPASNRRLRSDFQPQESRSFWDWLMGLFGK